MRRFPHCVLLLLLGLLAASVLAYDDEEESYMPTIELEMPDHPINVYKETATNRIAIKWKHEVDYEGWFTSKGIPLTWVFDLDDDWSVYEAPSVGAANAIMENILNILSDKPARGPMDKPSVRRDIQDCIGGVVGENVYEPTAPKPADVPTECANPLPNACPAEGLWGLNYIKAPSVWNALPGVVNEKPTEAVMVIDTGVLPTHEDLKGNLKPELTVQYVGGNPSTVTDRDGHGSHVAGTIFAKWNNGKDSAVGVVGSALGGVCGCGTPRLLAGFCLTRCVNHATENNVRVINLSFSGKQTARMRADDPTRRAYKKFCDEGGLAIAAAGNDNKNIIEAGDFNYPQTLASDLEGTNPKCILNVANIEKTGILASSSNYGEYVKIAAPGTDILSVGIASNTDTATKTGTSMAAPHVSGMATLLFNAFPGVTPARVYDCIVNTAKRPVQPNGGVAKPKPVNGGIADLQAAYECLRESPTCPTTGLPPCVDPKSGVAVKTCSTKFFCKQLNKDYVCQYRFAVDGTLCQNNQTGIFAKVTSSQLSRMGLSEKPTGDVAASIMRTRSKHTRSHRKRPYNSDKPEYTDDKDTKNKYNYEDKDTYEYKPKSDTDYKTKDSYETKRGYDYDRKDTYGKDTYGDKTKGNGDYDSKDTYSKDTYGDKTKGDGDYDSKDTYRKDTYSKDTYSDKTKGDDDYDSKDTYGDKGDGDYKQKRKPEYHQSHSDYYQHHLQTCGVCRQGQCVSEYREWCTESKHSYDHAEKDNDKEY